jgi:hypothetical protein
MHESAKEIRRALRTLRAEMRAARIRKTSPFNGGMDRKTQRWRSLRVTTLPKRFAISLTISKCRTMHSTGDLSRRNRDALHGSE